MRINPWEPYNRVPGPCYIKQQICQSHVTPIYTRYTLPDTLNSSRGVPVLGNRRSQRHPTHEVYQGLRLSQRIVQPESTRILMEAASAARTVSLTACIRFWAFPTNISVASWSSLEPTNTHNALLQTHTTQFQRLSVLYFVCLSCLYM